jgi:hypothetical protein
MAGRVLNAAVPLPTAFVWLDAGDGDPTLVRARGLWHRAHEGWHPPEHLVHAFADDLCTVGNPLALRATDGEAASGPRR